MTANVLFAMSVVVWLFAAYAFLRVVMSWVGVMRLARSGERLDAALELGFWNFDAVRARFGPAAVPHIETYRQGFVMFFGAVGSFMILVIFNIVSGNAA